MQFSVRVVILKKPWEKLEIAIDWKSIKFRLKFVLIRKLHHLDFQLKNLFLSSGLDLSKLTLCWISSTLLVLKSPDTIFNWLKCFNFRDNLRYRHVCRVGSWYCPECNQQIFVSWCFEFSLIVLFEKLHFAVGAAFKSFSLHLLRWDLNLGWHSKYVGLVITVYDLVGYQCIRSSTSSLLSSLSSSSSSSTSSSLLLSSTLPSISTSPSQPLNNKYWRLFWLKNRELDEKGNRLIFRAEKKLCKLEADVIRSYCVICLFGFTTFVPL